MLTRTARLLAPVFATLLVVGGLLVVGCSQSPQNVAEGETDHSECAVSKAASDFLTAVFDGDTQRADAHLTPLAAQRLAESGQRFAPPGSGPTSFVIGEMRLLGEGRAAVECLVRGELDGEPVEEVLGCLLKQVDDRWAVSGIAYETTPNQPPTVFDFEQPVPRSPELAGSTPAGSEPSQTSGPMPSVPRTAGTPQTTQTR